MQRLIAIIASLLAALSSARCRTRYFIADFDDVDVDQYPYSARIPAPYASVQFFNFGIGSTNGDCCFNAIDPPSGENVAYAADSNLGHIEQEFQTGYGNNGYLFGLESFYFACIAYRFHGWKPVPCSLMLISRRDLYQGIDTHTYEFEPHGIKNGKSKMKHVSSPGIAKAEFLFFELVGGPSDAVLTLDHLNISQRYAKDYDRAC